MKTSQKTFSLPNNRASNKDSHPKPQVAETIASRQELMQKRKQELIESLKPYLAIKEKLKMLHFLKVLFENIIIMLIWFSCIFKQNIYSFLLFIMLVIYTYNRSYTTLTIARTIVLFLIFVQYLSQVVDFSSYNSNLPFP